MLGQLFLAAAAAAGLRVTTDSPDALCPPLEQAQQATRARLGEVEGGPYEARYVLVRDAETGSDSLRLMLTDAEGKTLLERTLPITPGGCKDASQAIALILERYFRGVSGARPVATPADSEASSSLQSPPQSQPSARPADTAQAGAREPSPRSARPAEPPEIARDTHPGEPEPGRDAVTLLARGGGGINQAGSPIVAIGTELSPLPFLGLGLDGLFALAPGTQNDQTFELETTTHSLILGSLFVLGPWNRWSLGAGPWLGMQRQVINLIDDGAVPEGNPTRWVSAAGAQVALRFEATRNLRLDLLQRVGAQLSGTRFVILDSDAAETEVMALPDVTWDLSLSLGFLVLSES